MKTCKYFFGQHLNSLRLQSSRLRTNSQQFSYKNVFIYSLQSRVLVRSTGPGLVLVLCLILVVAAWFILMNVRLFVSSVFTDCQRDLLAGWVHAARGGVVVTLYIAFVAALSYTVTHTNTHSHAHTHTLAYVRSQKLLHTLRKLTAFPFLARMQNDHSPTAPAALPRPVHLPTRTFPFCIYTILMTLFLCSHTIF